MLMKHFRKLCSDLKVTGYDERGDRIEMSRQGFKALLSALLRNSEFDEDWYLETYPDVRKGIEAGTIADAHDHYVNHGYFEGRLPGLRGFDAETYAELNPDVVRAIHGASPDARRMALINHFLQFGYKEGRSVQHA